MKQISSKKFEAKFPKVLIAFGLGAAVTLAYFTSDRDGTKSMSPAVTSMEIAKPVITPEGLKMSEIGKVILSNKSSETFYACITNISSTEKLLIDRVVLNPAKGTKIDNYTTNMTDARHDRLQSNKTIASTQASGNWGVGNNTADTITQEMIINPSHSNYITFYASIHASAATAKSVEVNYVQPFYHLVSDKTFVKC